MNTLRLSLAAMGLAWVVLAPCSAIAQEFKMGFVNTERIFRESATARQA